ncbi:hypothetical protein [Puia dinghuensis]|uniref:Adhesin domain-containing protein n=1 Tax=Puia dinghuensis TaxID=1792502 RepID=A0A8J2U8M0_9BACT|nr:hypothetical protein [Puia dinghuensis]GGA86717.1 hypothetical protein GCM10011511_07220 [Puia dinghuensis]
MKTSILITLLTLALLPTQAQKIIEKHIPFSPNNFVAMNFQISDSIRIITWKKNEVYVKSSINVNDNQNNDDYNMVFDETGNTINVSGKLETKKLQRHGKDSGNCCCCYCNYNSTIIHEVYIPENAGFSVETINGNIVITGNTAEIKARSISGFIDLSIAPDRKAEVKMHTISGTMYSNIELTSTSRRVRQVGGGSVRADLNGGGKPIDLETISGNIFFRKES